MFDLAQAKYCTSRACHPTYQQSHEQRHLDRLLAQKYLRYLAQLQKLPLLLKNLRIEAYLLCHREK